MKANFIFGLLLVSTILLIAQAPVQSQSKTRMNLEITSVNGEPIARTLSIDGYSALVRGTIGDTTLGVFLLTRSFFDDDWWVQNPVTRLSGRDWQGIAQLGDEKRGMGDFFEIAALADANPNALKTGEQLKFLPDTLIRSDIVTVSRGTPRFDIVDLTQKHPKPQQVGQIVLVRGKAPDPHSSVYVMVHPMLSPVWYVQKIPALPNRDGAWRTTCYLGGERQGIGDFFEIVAVYADAKNLFHRDQELKAYPNNLAHSPVITVKRVR